ncbi:MAG: hypothetical protein INH41_11390 [Myxococcaceae bacterium]|nr:hypothetical protein [Myxococcaceae bacterium]MCA3012985.1 hypothetical protein [Myxococcaceae bacterium]
MTFSDALLEELLQELPQLARGRGETAVPFSALNGLVMVEGVADDPQVAREIALALEELKLPTEGGQRDTAPAQPPQPPRPRPRDPSRSQASAPAALQLAGRSPKG